MERVVLERAVASEGGYLRLEVERIVLNALPQGVAALPPNIAPSGDSFAMVFMRSESTLIASEAGARSPQRVGRINPVTVAEAAESDAVVGSDAASALL
jgi:hypothetical protein